MHDPVLVTSMLQQLDAIASDGYGDIPLLTLVEQLEYDALVREFPLSKPGIRVHPPGPANHARSKRMAMKNRRIVCKAILSSSGWSDGTSTFVPMSSVWDDAGCVVIDMENSTRPNTCEQPTFRSTDMPQTHDQPEEHKIECQSPLKVRPFMILIFLVWVALFTIGSSATSFHMHFFRLVHLKTSWGVVVCACERWFTAVTVTST